MLDIKNNLKHYANQLNDCARFYESNIESKNDYCAQVFKEGLIRDLKTIAKNIKEIIKQVEK